MVEKTCSGITRKGHSRSRYPKYTKTQAKTTKGKVLSNEDLRRDRINHFRRGTALSFEQAERLYYRIGMDEFER